jgi:glycosyltransferase involved in cell wall biosynthesis
LLLAGEFQEAAAHVQATAADLRLEEHVRFLGAVTDVAGLLQASDLFTFSTKDEGCPNGVLEAMAAGLAVVATDDAGVREAVGPEGQSLLAPPRDPERLGQQILAAMRDPELRARHGAVNRQRIQQEFSVTAMCRNTVDVIEEAWQGAAPARATFLALR